MKSLIFLTSIVWCLILLFGCSASRPKNLGAAGGRLVPCPHSPNCVSTQAVDDVHKIAPFSYTSTKEQAMDRLVAVINSMPRTRIVTRTDTYLYVEFTTALMRYVDDVEFCLNDEKKTIDFRSASRIGYGDMGVNRKRMEEVSRRFMAEK
jgi:uncharacterized protein (DUF1499 family)